MLLRARVDSHLLRGLVDLLRLDPLQTLDLRADQLLELLRARVDRGLLRGLVLRALLLELNLGLADTLQLLREVLVLALRRELALLNREAEILDLGGERVERDFRVGAVGIELRFVALDLVGDGLLEDVELRRGVGDL